MFELMPHTFFLDMCFLTCALAINHEVLSWIQRVGTTTENETELREAGREAVVPVPRIVSHLSRFKRRSIILELRRTLLP